MIKVLVLADKNFKAAVFSDIKENMLIMNQ